MGGRTLATVLVFGLAITTLMAKLMASETSDQLFVWCPDTIFYSLQFSIFAPFWPPKASSYFLPISCHHTSSAALTHSSLLSKASQLILMLSAGLYTPPNIFTQVIYAPAELFLGVYRPLICWINPITQTGPLPIHTIFACSISAYLHWNRFYTPNYNYGKLSCLGPELPAPLRPSILTISPFNRYSATFLPISDSQFP